MTMNKYDLEERTLAFGIKLTKSLKSLQRDIINYKLIGQVIGSGTSIGANYMEANGAESRKDFKHKIHISLKEAKETQYWLRLIEANNPQKSGDLTELLDEANQLTLIFSKIASSLRNV